MLADLCWFFLTCNMKLKDQTNIVLQWLYTRKTATAKASFFWCNFAVFSLNQLFQFPCSSTLRKPRNVYWSVYCYISSIEDITSTKPSPSKNKYLTAINTIHLLKFLKPIIEWKHLLRKFEVQNVSKQIPDAVVILLYMI